MTKFKKRRKYKLSCIYIFIISMILFWVLFFFNNYAKYTNKKIINVATIKLNEMMESVVSNNINYSLLKNASLNNILEIDKNSNDEIIKASFNLEKAYLVLDYVTKELEEVISSRENDYHMELPMFIGSNNILISSLGPKVYVPVKFVDSILTNLRTNITDYGLNNALVEIYVTISLKSDLISPVNTKRVELKYEALIASSVIAGRVPSIYGGSYTETLK